MVAVLELGLVDVEVMHLVLLLNQLSVLVVGEVLPLS